MTKKVYVTKSSRETQELGQKFAIELKDDEVIALFGNLGSGKTTFVQGLAKGLGIKGRIISPTFIIIREHNFDGKKFYHVDLYRVQKINELKELELEEIIKNKSGIVVIEWAEKIKNLLPEKRIEIYFEYISDNERKIVVKRYKQELEFSY